MSPKTSKEFDLNTLNYILDEISKDFTEDSSKLLTNLIKTISESAPTFQNKKVFSGLKVLLNLYENSHTSNKSFKTEFPINNLIHSIKHILLCENENCNLPDTEIQYNILSIISSLFKITLIQNSQENLEKLADFYIYLLNFINLENKCKPDCLIFKLKILNSVYNTLSHIPNDEFLKKVKLKNNINECEQLAKLVLHENENIAIQTLMYVIPEYLNCYKTDRIVKVTWKQITDTVSNKYFRVLIILCFFFDVCFERSKIKTDLIVLLLEDKNYWKLLQIALVEKDPLKRKQGMYLLKKTLELLNNGKFICHQKDVFYWDSNNKEELYKIYSEVVIALEYLEEQQVHIIKPIFSMIETLGRNLIECGKVNFSWLLLLYKKALMHESTQIVLWGLDNLLKLPEKFYLDEVIASETIVLLVQTLNNMSLYYNKGLTVSKEVNDFFKRLINLQTFKNLLKLYIKQICCHVWSAEALFFVMHSLSGIQECAWGEEEITMIETFVSKAFNTHNKIIRIGIQCEFLNSIAAFTDKGDVGVDKIIHLVSKLSTRKLIKTPGWDNFIYWLDKSYSKQEVEDILEKFKKKPLGEEFNGKFISLTLILSSYGVHSQNDYSFSVKYLHEVFLSFKDIDKRPYCNKLLCDEYLSVVCGVYDSNLNYPMDKLVKPTLPFAKDAIAYIKTQLHQISNLDDFDSCQSYLNSFEILSKTLLKYNVDVEVLNEFYVEILEELEMFKDKNSSLGIFWRVKVLSVSVEFCSFDEKGKFLICYLLKSVNEPLVKTFKDSKTTRDLQTLWGKLNSEFLEGKWKLLDNLIKNKLIVFGERNVKECWRIECDDLVRLCGEALNTGGYGVLKPVLNVLKEVLPVLERLFDVKCVVDAVWKLIMERRKTEEFKVYVKHFVEMLYQEDFIGKGDSVKEILLEYVDFIYSDSSLAVVNIFMKHVQKINLLHCSMSLFCNITGRGVIFGPVQKKDERLTNQVCQHLESLNICQARRIGELNTGNEIRGRAIQMILTLDKRNPIHRTAAKNLMETLFKMEMEINKNRIRYFSNSHVHRVKHRLMQGLLLLEPFLHSNENQAIELSDWLYRGLLTETSQQSVRYQQEWLLVRMLIRHSDLYHRHLNYYNNESLESNKRGVCSLIAIGYHLCKLIPLDLMEERIGKEMHQIFSLCFHQHFEVRLYAQVVFHKLFIFAQTKGLTKVLNDFKYINESLREVFEKNLKGNFSKNLEKLLEDFYFTEFDPLGHYSLDTIYVDLPRLTNVDSDEWISTETFECSGVDLKNVSIPPKNSSPLFKYTSAYEKLLKENIKTDSSEDEILSNYQKKVIPNKPLLQGFEEKRTDSDGTIKKDGLIVVASLIDRIPNLGGLARTCEIFGASEYVVNSLKYLEDKQFTSLSVTAEKWISVKEVKIQNLFDYITEVKLDGYSIIGAEQTLHSVPLNSAKFPKKSLLLLGNEKEGIPPNLLPLLDVCVEIPQLGIIRSLNVHVSGALFIWEYAKQNHFV